MHWIGCTAVGVVLCHDPPLPLLIPDCLYPSTTDGTIVVSPYPLALQPLTFREL